MSIENVYSIAPTLGGGFVASFLVGYFIKKIIRVLMFVFGGILALLMYLQSQEMLKVEVNMDKIQSSAETAINAITINLAQMSPTDNNPSFVDSNLSIPFTGSIASGFMLGVTRRA
jgi:uncharacterized membrane protein (Fun14 family)